MLRKKAIFMAMFMAAAILLPQTSFSKQRYVSLKPSITETLFAVGAGKDVVGVTKWCDRPDEAKALPKVADYIKPNIEKIIALKPTLVLASKENSIKEPLAALHAAGVDVNLFSFDDINETLLTIYKIANVTGHKEEGQRVTDAILAELNRLPAKPRFAKMARREVLRVLVVVGHHPLVAAGPKTFLGELVEHAGGRNVIQSKMPYPRVSMETVIADAPDVIIDLSMGSEEKNIASASEFWAGYPLVAVKKGNVFVGDMSDFRAGPRIAEEIRTIKRWLETSKR